MMGLIIIIKRALGTGMALLLFMCCPCFAWAADFDLFSTSPIERMCETAQENEERVKPGQPTIECWGDSMTEGAGADFALIIKGDYSYDASFQSYPEILEKLTNITTLNYGISGTTSAEIASYKKGLIFFNKLKAISHGTTAQNTAQPNTILVLEIGSNGGWGNDYDALIKQYRDMIECSGCDKYIIIGDTDDPGTSVADLEQEPFHKGQDARETSWEAALRESFGDHFINMRAYLIKHGLDSAGLIATEEDIEDVSYGCVPTQLRADWTHLNSYGYYAQAIAIFEKGKSLKYW